MSESKSSSVLKKAYISNKVFYPIEDVDVEKIRARYTLRQHDETICSSCENRPFRHNDICDACPRGAYLGEIRLYNSMNINNQPYVGVPVGDKLYHKTFGVNYSDYQYIDKRTAEPFGHQVVFTGTLYPNQQLVIDDFLTKKYGLIKAPPRTGKGPMVVYASVKLGLRTLILANQIEFLDQILGHVKSMTNITSLEKKTGIKLCGFPEKPSDYDTFLFMVSTYQKFLSPKGKLLLEQKVRPNFGTVIVDEVHTAAALRFSQVLGSMKPRYLFGCTATVERKDKKHVIIERLIGPITAESHKESLPVLMDVLTTEVKHKRNYVNFVYAMRYLSNDVKRNKLIVDNVIKQLEQGESIVIPVMFKSHVFNLVKEINDRWGSAIAEPFTGGGNLANKKERQNILDRCRKNETRVIVGIRKLLQLGVDVPQWTRLFEVMPISNKPNLLQETSRIRTPCESKPDKKPMILFFVDCEIGQSLGCFRATVGHLKSPEFSMYSWTVLAKERLGRILKGDGTYYGGKRDSESIEKMLDDQYKPSQSLFKEAPTDTRRSRRL